MLRIALRVRLRQRLTSFPTASAQDDTSKWRWRWLFDAGCQAELVRLAPCPLPGYGKSPRLCVAVTSVCHPERKRNEVKRNFAEVEVLARERASRAKTEGISKQILMAFLD